VPSRDQHRTVKRRRWISLGSGRLATRHPGRTQPNLDSTRSGGPTHRTPFGGTWTWRPTRSPRRPGHPVRPRERGADPALDRRRPIRTVRRPLRPNNRSRPNRSPVGPPMVRPRPTHRPLVSSPTVECLGLPIHRVRRAPPLPPGPQAPPTRMQRVRNRPPGRRSLPTMPASTWDGSRATPPHRGSTRPSRSG
jgi:hypothetical protein